MKIFYSLLTVLMLTSVYSCNRNADEGRGSDVTIEREEEYNSDDVSETRTVPLERDEEINVDRDALGDDEVEIED